MNYGLDQVEDALEEGLKGFGEVTGSGTGNWGCDFDIEVTEEMADVDRVVGIIRKALKPFRLPNSAVIVVREQEFDL